MARIRISLRLPTPWECSVWPIQSCSSSGQARKRRQASSTPLGRRIREGESLLPGQIVTFDDWPHRIVPEVVPNSGEIVFEANQFYARPREFSVPVLQLSYDDNEGRFPWEDEYVAPEMQPRPGTFTA